jgi:endoglucanase
MKILVPLLLIFSSLCSFSQERVLPEASWENLPRWRGFNLLEKFSIDWSNGPFKEEDFKMISELGFNFVRLPMDYRAWIKDGDWRSFNENTLKEIDQAVGWGQKYGIHVCINFHRAPGYTVAQPREARSLWYDEEALDVCALHWSAFAKRYKGIPNKNLSFNLFNEPAGVSEDDYYNVAKKVSEAIRKEDPERLIISDGLDWGRTPSLKLKELKMAQSARGYTPGELTHYKAEWVSNSDRMLLPSWPKLKLKFYYCGPLRKELPSPFTLNDAIPDRLDFMLRNLRANLKSSEIIDRIVSNEIMNRGWLWKTNIEPWVKMEEQGIGIMVGEWGAYNKTPHDVVLRWMKDCLENWETAGWGWALWNFRGSFGVLDSERGDVSYEDFKGHKLDREMLELLQRY